MSQLVAANLGNQLAGATPGDGEADAARANAQAIGSDPPTDPAALASAKAALDVCTGALLSAASNGASGAATTATAAAISANPELLSPSAVNSLNSYTDGKLDTATEFDESTGTTVINTIANVAAAPVPVPDSHIP